MSLMACRECGQPVSSEAAACPHCGLVAAAPTAPETPVAPRSRPKRFGVGAVVLLVVAVGAVYTVGNAQGWFPTGTLSSTQVAAAISDRYTKISGHQIDVTCPTIPKQKGKISDCTATQAGDMTKTTAVFVTQIDAGGHFTFQSEDASVLIDVPDALPDAPAVGAPSPEPVLSDTDAAKQNDKGWVVEAMSFKTDPDDTLGVVMRIKNANAEGSTAVFTVTVVDGATVVATYHGSAQGVVSGQTVTVDTYSTDAIPLSKARSLSKSAQFQFQTDTSLPG